MPKAHDFNRGFLAMIFLRVNFDLAKIDKRLFGVNDIRVFNKMPTRNWVMFAAHIQ